MQNHTAVSGNSIRALGLVAALALAAISASADTLTVSQTETWGALVPTTAESGPNETWSFSFDVDSSPAVSNVTAGEFFSPAITGVVFYLNGVLVPGAITGINFYNSSQSGLIDVFFADGSVLTDYGAQAYSGPESSPTILTGIYPTSPNSNFLLSSGDNEPISGNLVISSSTPEPSSLLLLGSGLVGLGGLLRRKLRL